MVAPYYIYIVITDSNASYAIHLKGFRKGLSSPLSIRKRDSTNTAARQIFNLRLDFIIQDYQENSCYSVPLQAGKRLPE